LNYGKQLPKKILMRMGSSRWKYPLAHKKEVAVEGISNLAKQPLPQNRFNKNNK